MENKINDIMRQATEDRIGSKIFYSSLWPREKKFEVSYSGFTQFITNYCAIIHSTIQEKSRAYSLASSSDGTYDATMYGCSFAEEAVDNRVPIMVNMKFEISDQEVINIYTPKFIYICTSIIQEAIIHFFNVSDNLTEVICFLLESDIWSENGKQYTSIRFQFPYTLVDIDYINNTFLPYILSEFASENVLHFLTVTPLISLKEIILPQTSTVVSHGCKTSSKHSPLCLTSILRFISFNSIPEQDMEISEFFIPLANSSITPLQNSLFSRRFVDQSILDYIDDPVYWIPLILSIHFTAGITPILNGNNIRVPSPPIAAIENTNIDRWTPKMKLQELLPMISPSRIKVKNFWYDVGRCIHNIYDGGNIGLSIWQDITSDIEHKDECEDKYRNFTREYFDIRTIAEYAKADNPERYAAWHHEWIYNDLIYSLAGDHVQTAHAVYKTLWLEYLYDASSTTWYHYTENHCKRDLGGLEIARDLTDQIIPIYMNLRREFADKSTNESNPGARKSYEETIKCINAMIKKLSTSGFRDAVVKIAREFFKDDNFNTYNDENLDTMGWRNGVTECYDETITFRGGKLQDYITKSTHNSFPSHFDDYHPQLPFMYEYYSMLHTDADLRHFFLKDQGSFLQGGNPEKYFRNLIGKSDASKSQYIKFLQEAFGEYCVDLPNSSITLDRRGNSGGPDPALEQCKGARLSIVAETSIAEPLDCAKIKKYTGNDRYFNRSLHKEGGSRKLSFKLIHMSNVVAHVPNSDEAFDIRNILLWFGSRWVENPPATREEQFRLRLFKRDENFVRKIRMHTSAQIYLMFKYYPIYRREGLRNLPACVVRDTLAHQQSNDPFFNFIEDKILFVYSDRETKTLDASVVMPTMDLYAHFKRWFTSNYPQVAPCDQIRFRIEMIKNNRLGEQNSSRQWNGVALKDEIKSQ